MERLKVSEWEKTYLVNINQTEVGVIKGDFKKINMTRVKETKITEASLVIDASEVLPTFMNFF